MYTHTWPEKEGGSSYASDDTALRTKSFGGHLKSIGLENFPKLTLDHFVDLVVFLHGLRFRELSAGIVWAVVDGGGEHCEAVVVVPRLAPGSQSPRRQVGVQLPYNLVHERRTCLRRFRLLRHFSLWPTFPNEAAFTGCMLFLLQKST